MSDQEFVYNKAPYKKEHEARIIGISTELGIKLDEPIFYPRGGCLLYTSDAADEFRV